MGNKVETWKNVHVRTDLPTTQLIRGPSLRSGVLTPLNPPHKRIVVPTRTLHLLLPQLPPPLLSATSLHLWATVESKIVK